MRKASAFREVASKLTGELLAEEYRRELENAPRRQDAGKKYFVAPSARLSSSRRKGRDEEHLAISLVRYCRETGPAPELPDGHTLDLFHGPIPLRAAAPDKKKGDADPNKGVDHIDALGIGSDDRMVVVKLKFLPPEATRGGTGDTPLRALLEGLANCAISTANREALQSEVNVAGGRTMVDEPPILLLLASPRYWDLCRRREAQRGAAWIREMERLGREIEEAIGVTVFYHGLKLNGDPGWEYGDGLPKLTHTPRILEAWEPSAGKLKPKPRPRPKAPGDTSPVIVEADLSREIRSYAASESYEPGERISHHTLGMGVVQGGAGPGKIHVNFDGKMSLLVHGRQLHPA